MAELTENAKDYIECLKDILQRKYLLSGEKALDMITSSYIIESLIVTQKRHYMMILRHMQIIFTKIG